MKTSHFKQVPIQQSGFESGPAAAHPPLFACDTLLWIGDTEHPSVVPAWRACQRLCDAISVRRSISDAVNSPSCQSFSHILIAQTNRHERGTCAIDGPDLAALRDQYANMKMLVLRGSLVAPTVRLPVAAGSMPGTQAQAWVDSVALSEAVTYLKHWFRAASIQHQLRVVSSSSDRRSGPATMSAVQATPSLESLLPVVIVAARFELAESLIDSLPLLFPGKDSREPLVQWQRDLTPRSGRGFATVIWDESVATPETARSWRHRCGLASHARHVWMTGMATPQERELAREQGVYEVLDKPGRIECLAASVRAA